MPRKAVMKPVTKRERLVLDNYLNVVPQEYIDDVYILWQSFKGTGGLWLPFLKSQLPLLELESIYTQAVKLVESEKLDIDEVLVIVDGYISAHYCLENTDN